MAANKSDYSKQQTLDLLLNGGEHLALFVTDPGATGTGTEVAGGTYARKPITWGAYASGQKVSTGAINFTGLPATSINYWAIYDAVTGGNLLYYGALSTGVTVTAGGTFDVLAGNLIIAEA